MSDFAARIAALPAEKKKLLARLIERDGGVFNAFQVSFAQERLWFLDQLAPGSPLYNIPVAVRFSGRLDAEALVRSWSGLVGRHESLRTHFVHLADQPLQVVEPAAPQSLPMIDLRALSPRERDETVRRLAAEESRRPFDLGRGPLVRIFLLQLEAGEHVILLTLHHIVSDGWSIGVLMRELVALYEGFRTGCSSALPELPIQYKDFSRWQRRWLSGERLQAEVEHWKRQLAGAPPEIELPTDRPRPPVQSFRGAVAGVLLPRELSDQLAALASRRGATPFMTLLSAFGTLLHRHTRQHDVLLGTAIANRTRPEIEGLIGFFVNTLVLRLDLAGDPPFRELLERAREVTLEAYAHQDLPFEKLVAAIHPERSLGRSPIFQAAFDLQNLPVAGVELPELRLSPVEVESRSSKYDLRLSMRETARGLACSFEYASDLFDRTTIQRLGERFQTLLAALAADDSRPLSSLDLLPPAELHQVLHEWNDTEREESWPPLAHVLFEARTDDAPETAAAVFGMESLTYRELDTRANRLAHHLASLGAGPEVLVGICVERSFDMVVAILGVLKAGAAYLPLDPGNPPARLRFMAEDSRLALLLTHRHLLDRLPETGARVVLLDADHGAIDRQPDHRPAVPMTGEALAYVIYTSGSTGRPKGAWLTHRGLCNLARAFIGDFDLRPGSRILQFSFFNFDASVVEIFMTLLGGSTLYLAPQEELMPGPDLVALLRERRITAAIIPPSVLAAVPEAGLPDLRTLIVAGEACGAELVTQWGTGRHFFNAYGPTEATVCASFTRCLPEEGRPTIGRPIANVRTHVLDPLAGPVPIGVPGELHIGGVGVGRGYLGRPELTADKFVPDPLGEPGARLYRTGDLVRLLPDGNLDFLGRIDHQVKVRGFRIELGEIEAVLRQHPSVRQAVVAARGEGEKRVVAYIVTGDGEAPTDRELRGYLEERLPKYMVPAVLVPLPALPLNSSGKLDLSALPDPRERRLAAEADFRAPQTSLEKIIAEIWREILGVERVGLHDNFFDLGGHSLLLARVQGRLREALGLEVALIDLFTYPSISSLAGHLHGLDQREDATAPPMIVRPAAGEGGSAVAVIGMSLRAAGSRNLEEFWANLRDGVETITFFSDEELLAAGVSPALLADPRYVKAGPYLEGMELFDAAFFGINPRQATVMDPQQRIFLECAWEAMESAGYDTESSTGGIGLYAGTGASSYMFNLFSNPELVDSVGVFQVALGNDKDHLATRTSYYLNLQGPSITVQTSCSTSLVAVHLACRSLLGGECDMALAGGVSIDSRGKAGYLFQEGGIRSPDGHCRAFDAGARGAMNGSGAGVVVLKRLADALRDGDTVRAVIRGSAINNDGSAKVGYTAPRIEGQAQVIREAQLRAGVTAEEISYVEAHGTGTELGDPIEVAALTHAFRASTDRRQYCALGSVKASIGHLDAAAGVTGLIKTVLALEHGMIPPSLHFERPNPKIDFASSPFFVNDRLREWSSEGPRRAGVSSFGIGGTNAHVVVEEGPAPAAPSSSRSAHLLVLSARTASALDTAAENLARHLVAWPEQDLADVEHTLQVGRRTFSNRRVVVCRDTAEAVEALAGRRPERVLSLQREQRDRSLVFLFTGHGAQYVDMGRELYEGETVFRDAIDLCAEHLEPSLGLDLRRILYPEPPVAEAAASRLGSMALAQPILFAVEYALARLWVSWAGLPKAMIGHSMGEYVAACLSGVLSLEGALTLVAARGRLMEETSAGGMLAVPLPEEEVVPLLRGDLSLAAINGPARCVVSGPVVALERLQDLLAQRGLDCRRLHISIAGHSLLMDPILDRFAEEVARVELHPPGIPYVSNLTGTWITAAQATDPAYWVDHLRSTVRFADGLRELWRSTDGVLLEVGPGRSLTTLAVQHPERPAEREVFSSLSHAQERSSDLEFALTTLGRLWLSGVRVNWRAFHADGGRRRVPLPTYPFERRRYWVEPARGARRALPEREARFSTPSWIRTEERLRPGRPAQRWLVLVDEQGLGAALARGLETLGRQVVEVRAGESFQRRGEADFAVNPRIQEDFESLARELSAAGFAPQGIVHCWSIAAESDGGATALADGLELGLRGLLRIARAFAGGPVAPSRAVILSNSLQSVTGDEWLAPTKAAILGLCGASLPEAPGLVFRNVDVVPPTRGGAAEARWVDALIAELDAEEAPAMVAYRGRHRWVRTVQPVRFGAEPAEAPVRKGDVCVLIGRLSDGGFGLTRHLARRGCRLTLIESEDGGDAGLERRQNRIVELEELGAEVTILPVDTADPGELRAALASLRERFGPPAGVVVAIEVEPADSGLETAGHTLTAALAIHSLLAAGGFDFAILSLTEGGSSGGPAVAHEAVSALLGALARQGCEQGSPIRFIRWSGGGPATDEEAGEVLERVLEEAVPEIQVVPRALREAASGFEVDASGVAVESTAPESLSAPPENELQRRIAALWEGLLGRPVGLHDNFFDLGGDSLIAISLTAKMRQTFQVELPLRRILEAPTVAALAAMVEEALPRPAASAPAPPGANALPATVVEIQAGAGSQLLFFTVHAAGGSVLCYYNLARHLGAEQPVYALEAPGFDGHQQVFDKLEDLAAHHVAAIRAVQPQGPYLLGGWSAGGTIAFEIARQLDSAGQEVALVALIDTYAPVDDYEFDDLRMLMWQAWRFKLPLAVQDFQGLDTFDEKLDLLIFRAFESGVIPAHISTGEARRVLSVEIANLKAMLNYRPGPYPGELSFFRSQEGTDFGEFKDLFPWVNEIDHAAAWSKLTARRIRICEVPGSHGALMDEPNVQVLARSLRECIARVEDGRGAKAQELAANEPSASSVY